MHADLQFLALIITDPAEQTVVPFCPKKYSLPETKNRRATKTLQESIIAFYSFSKINDIMKHESDHENILRTTQRNFTNYLIYILHYIRKKDNQLNLIPPIASFLILIKTQV